MPKKVWSKNQLFKWHIQKTGNLVNKEKNLVVPNNHKMRLILDLAKKELSMDHQNEIGDLDKIEDLIESDKMIDLNNRKTQQIFGNMKNIEKRLDENIKTVTMN